MGLMRFSVFAFIGFFPGATVCKKTLLEVAQAYAADRSRDSSIYPHVDEWLQGVGDLNSAMKELNDPPEALHWMKDCLLLLVRRDIFEFAKTYGTKGICVNARLGGDELGKAIRAIERGRTIPIIW